ncbi:MAG: peptidylprolyl isomerase [Bacteroidetes bacterium]|nr:peptidylprolyl isomerase [Bacteroidota bacterium]
MNRSLLILLLIASSFTTNAQVIFRYGSQAVQKDEFWKAYTKNNTGNATEKNIREYLDLYIKFKLKVQAAKDQKLDTLASIKNDVAGFRAQMAEQYLQKLPFRKTMITEAVERSKSQLEIAQVFVSYGADSAAAKTSIENAYKSLQSGADFNLTSREYSSDPALKAKDGYVGFVTALSLPYEIENIVYALKPGAYSKPVAGRRGWHIIKLIKKENSLPLLKAAHILLAVDPEGGQEEKALTQKKADSLYQALLKGADFGVVAQQFSNDKFSYQSGGELPLFGLTDADPAFAKAAYALKNNGDISTPVETEAGFHIIRLIGREEQKRDLNEPEVYEKWSEKVSQSDRMQLVLQKEKDAVKTASGYKALPYNEKELWTLSDSLLAATDYAAIYKANKQKKLFELTGQTITVTDWLKFIKDKKLASGNRELNGYKELMEEFTNTTVNQYYKDHLEKFNTDFRYQMQEFFEGSLLFEVMERNVWSVAPKDSAGLQQFYAPRAAQYTWKKSVGAIVFNCADTATANKALASMQNDPLQWKTYMEEGNGYVLADSARFEIAQLPIEENTSLRKGWLSPVTTNPNDGSSSFCYITNIYSDNEVRSFEEAKGLVINDYQIYLEDKWLAEQKKKYPVKIDETVVKSLKK